MNKPLVATLLILTCAGFWFFITPDKTTPTTNQNPKTAIEPQETPPEPQSVIETQTATSDKQPNIAKIKKQIESQIKAKADIANRKPPQALTPSNDITVDAGLDFAIDELEIATFDASATIADGSTLKLKWLTTDEFYYRTEGVGYSKRESKDLDIRIINSHQLNARFEAPDVAQIRYVDLYLLAIDIDGNWNSDMVTVTINPVEPENVAFYEIDMPDRNLLRCVEEYANNRYITFVEEIKALNCDNFRIANLTGIEYFYNLESFSAINNHIKDIWPLTKLKKLRKLNLNRNGIYDLRPLAQLPYLSELRLRENQIADIAPLTELNLLDTLDLAKNKIEKTEEFANDFYLTHLNLADNPLESINGIIMIEGLKSLNLAGTPIKHIMPLFFYRSRLKLNPIEKLDISYCSNLRCDRLDRLESMKGLQLSRKGECRY